MIIFRKNALNKMSSADDLDKTIHIVNSVSWIALIALYLIGITFITWSILATVQTQAKAQGIFLPHDGIIVSVLAGDGGNLKQLNVEVGDKVKAGQVIAKLSSKTLSNNIRIAEDKLQIEQDYLQLTSKQIADEKQQREILHVQSSRYIDDKIDGLRLEIKKLQEEYDHNKVLYDQHIITESVLRSLTVNLDQLRFNLNDTILRKNELANNDNIKSNQEKIRLIDISKNIANYENQVNQLKLKEKGLLLKSPIAGLVIEIEANKNTQLASQQPVVSIVSSVPQDDARFNSLEYLAYVDVLHGKKIHPGTEVNISVSYLDRNRYGMIKGIVSSVSEFPLSSAGIRAKLSNQDLVNLFTKGGPVYQVIVELPISSESKSGLEWTGKQGREVKEVEIGSLGLTEFIIGKQHPISMMIPWVKSLFR